MTKFSCATFLSFLPSVYRKLFYSLRFQLHKFIHFHKNILRYVAQVLQPCKLSVNVEIMIFFNSLLKKIIFSSHRTKERSGQRHHFRYIWRLSEGLAFSCQGIDIFATINSKTLDLEVFSKKEKLFSLKLIPPNWWIILVRISENYVIFW